VPLSDLLEDATGKPFAEARYLGPVLGSLLDPSVLSSGELAPVQAYLASDASRDAADGRRVRLAQELSRRFAEDARRRPDVFDCWRAGLFVGDAEGRGAEAWQKRLWHEAIARWEAAPREARAVPAAVHLFGFSRLSRGEVLGVRRLSEETSVFVYVLNPCREIWEAIAEPFPAERSAGRRYERRGRELGPGEVYSFADPFRLMNPGELAPLRLWGRPGRESLRLLNALTGCELVARTRAPRGDTVLGQL
jgi:exonuclease V gamma subunit